MGSCTLTTLTCGSNMLLAPKYGKTVRHIRYLIDRVAFLPDNGRHFVYLGPHPWRVPTLTPHPLPSPDGLILNAFGEEPFSDTFIFCRAVYFIHNRAKRSGRAQVTSIRVLVSLSRVFHSVEPIRNLVEPLQCTEGHLMKLSPALTPCITLFVLLS